MSKQRATPPDEHAAPRGDAGLPEEVRRRLAEVSALEMSEDLVVGVWMPRETLCVLALAGEMDMNNAAEVSRVLARRLNGGQRLAVIVELSLLTFMDSSGISELIRAAKELERHGGCIVLAGPTPSVLRVLELVGLVEFIVIVETLDAALALLAEASSPRNHDRSDL